MNIFREYRYLIAIFFIALILRVIFLEKYPFGFHADEVRVGWNAYSILKTGHDDRGNLFALYYNTFGDYRPTAVFYPTVISIMSFGLNLFAVRFPGALMGALTVFPLFFLTKEITKNKFAAYLSCIFLTFSPWHWIVSRATSEAIMSLFFAIVGIVFFIKALKENRGRIFLFTFFLFVLSCLFYHSARPLTPIFLLITLLTYWKKVTVTSRNKGILTFIAGTIFVLILLSGKGSLSRFQQVSVSTDTTNKNTASIIKTRDQYLNYLSFDFLIADFPKPLRYRVLGVSILGSALTIFLFAGVIVVLQKKALRFPLVLFLLTPLPAAVTNEDAPNLHRAIFMLPFILILSSLGAVNLFSGPLKNKFFAVFIMLIFAFTSLTSILNYFGEGADDAAPYRNFGAVQLIQELNKLAPKYDHIFITNKPDSPYPWFAFLNKLDPKEFNKYAILRSNPSWNYKNITFTTNSCPAAKAFDVKTGEKGLILAIDGANCEKNSILHDIEGSKVIKEITNIDGSVVYRFWELENIDKN